MPFLRQRISHDVPRLRTNENLQRGRGDSTLVIIYHDWKRCLRRDELHASELACRCSKA